MEGKIDQYLGLINFYVKYFPTTCKKILSKLTQQQGSRGLFINSTELFLIVGTILTIRFLTRNRSQEFNGMDVLWQTIGGTYLMSSLLNGRLQEVIRDTMQHVLPSALLEEEVRSYQIIKDLVYKHKDIREEKYQLLMESMLNKYKDLMNGSYHSNDQEQNNFIKKINCLHYLSIANKGDLNVNKIKDNLLTLLSHFPDSMHQSITRFVRTLVFHVNRCKTESPPVIYLQGFPGVGKQKFSKMLAKLLEIPQFTYDATKLSEKIFFGTAVGDGYARSQEWEPSLLARSTIQAIKLSPGNLPYVIVHLKNIDQTIQLSRNTSNYQSFFCNINKSMSVDHIDVENFLVRWIEKKYTNYHELSLSLENHDYSNIIFVLSGSRPQLFTDEKINTKINTLVFDRISNDLKRKQITRAFKKMLSKKDLPYDNKAKQFQEELLRNDTEHGIDKIILSCEKYVDYFYMQKTFTQWEMPVVENNILLLTNTAVSEASLLEKIVYAKVSDRPQKIQDKMEKTYQLYLNLLFSSDSNQKNIKDKEVEKISRRLKDLNYFSFTTKMIDQAAVEDELIKLIGSYPQVLQNSIFDYAPYISHQN